MRLEESPAVTWEVVVKRCRREFAFEQKRLERECRNERRWLAEAIKAETIQDPSWLKSLSVECGSAQAARRPASRHWTGELRGCRNGNFSREEARW